MTIAGVPKPEGLCQKCSEREATETWVGDGGVIGWAHGMFQFWCKLCVVKEMLKHAVEVSEKIPYYQKLIARLEAGEDVEIDEDK